MTIKISSYLFKDVLFHFCLLIGAVTPFVEFYRGYSEVRTNHKINLTDESVTLHKDSINFVSPNYKDTKFAKYIGK